MTEKKIVPVALVELSLRNVRFCEHSPQLICGNFLSCFVALGEEISKCIERQIFLQP
jgi:hypothetical protein